LLLLFFTPSLYFVSTSYITLAQPHTAEIKEKNSRFITYAQAVYSLQEVDTFLEEVKKMHPKATHHCYAYRLGLDKRQNYRANDDGEPSGTAGKPILGQIDSKELSNVMLIVVRYYGGVKLGASGLISAYKAAAKNTLDTAQLIIKEVEIIVNIYFDYLAMNTVMTLVKKLPTQILQQVFDNQCYLQLRTAKKKLPLLLQQLEEVEGVKVNSEE